MHWDEQLDVMQLNLDEFKILNISCLIDLIDLRLMRDLT